MSTVLKVIGSRKAIYSCRLFTIPSSWLLSWGQAGARMFNVVPEAHKRHGCQFYVALFKCIFIVLIISIPLSKLLMHALVKKIKLSTTVSSTGPTKEVYHDNSVTRAVFQRSLSPVVRVPPGCASVDARRQKTLTFYDFDDFNNRLFSHDPTDSSFNHCRRNYNDSGSINYTAAAAKKTRV